MKTLKNKLLPLVILSFTLLLMGCPVSSSFPLGADGAEKIDNSLIGTWVNDSTNSEATKVKVEKESETAYNVTVEEKGSAFMAETFSFKGWITKVEGKTFMVLQERDSDELKETYYVYHLKKEKNKLITNDIGLKVGGTTAITSIETYREEVKASMKMEDFLTGEIVWKKN